MTQRLDTLKEISGRMSAANYAQQKGDAFNRIPDKLTDSVLRAHDCGEAVIGVYPMEPGADTTQVANLDLDDHEGQAGWEKVSEVAGLLTARLQSLELHPFAVRSRGGNGIHLWLLFAAPVSAATLRAFLTEEVIKPLGFTEGAGKGVAGGQIEVFPKQAKVRTNGVGNPICLPFAGRSCALDGAFSPVSEDRMPSLTINSPSIVNAFDTNERKKPKKSQSRGKLYFDEANLRDALGSIKTNDGQTWVKYGLAIRQSAFEAGVSDDDAYAIWSDWSKLHGFTDAAAEAKCKERWAGFKVGEATDAGLIRIGTIFFDAAQAGWTGHPDDGADRLIMYPPDKRMEAIIRKVQSALIKRGRPIYQRGGRLVRPIKLDQVEVVPDRHGRTAERRDAGATVLLEVEALWLQCEMNNVLQWYRPTKHDGMIPAYPDVRYATTLLSQKGQWLFPVLKGVINHPTLDRDGRVIDTPGYDRESELLLDFEPGDFPQIPPEPNGWHAAEALKRLAAPFRKFPFVDSGSDERREAMATASCSVHLSAMLTAVIRPSLDTAPVHGYTAPTPGSGKTMLAESAGVLATGVRPSLMSQSASEEEDEKRLGGMMLRGDAVVVIDNCERPLQGRFLCSMTTGANMDIRVLGKNDDNRTLHNTAFVMATGNNLTIASDMTRRVVMCTLDSGLEHPEQREFYFKPVNEVQKLRPELIVAALTILRAYHCAGRPLKVPAFGDFEDWSWVRGALVWLGVRDPVETRDVVRDNDPLRAQLIEVMDEWDRVLGNREVTVAEIGDPSRGVFLHLHQRLIDATGRPHWNAKSVGQWLTRNKDRPVAGSSFHQRPTGGRKAASWWLKGGKPLAEGRAATGAMIAEADATTEMEF